MNASVCIMSLISVYGAWKSAVSDSFYTVRLSGLAGDSSHDSHVRSVSKHVPVLFQTFPFILQS